MSQQLNPVDGGVIPQITTTTTEERINLFSPQYIKAEGLESRPTEWAPKGRPIYRRLPAISETYQVDFYNIVLESNLIGNTFVDPDIDKVGYVFVPYGVDRNGPGTSAVVEGDGDSTLLVQSGELVWEYGKTEVLPTLIDLEVLDVAPGRFELGYQLIYDDAPVAKLYSVEDFSLAGTPLNITASTDSVIGWRYPAVNAFIDTLARFWSNEDNIFSDTAQPTTAYLQWESELTQAYGKITLRCPAGTAHTGTARLYYVVGGELSPIGEVDIQRDTASQFFEFEIEDPSLQQGWHVEFSDTAISIQSINVSGLLTLLKPPAAPAPLAQLVMYSLGTAPKYITNTEGEQIQATYCWLANVTVGRNYVLEDIEDTRGIINRDYTPVADWLTKPFDDDLINLFEQVSAYPKLWMAPDTCMKQEYATLQTDQVQVEK
jgi:hypothetical protein